MKYTLDDVDQHCPDLDYRELQKIAKEIVKNSKRGTKQELCKRISDFIKQHENENPIQKEKSKPKTQDTEKPFNCENYDYRGLQKIAKEYKIKANQKASVLCNEIIKKNLESTSTQKEKENQEEEKQEEEKQQKEEIQFSSSLKLNSKHISPYMGKIIKNLDNYPTNQYDFDSYFLLQRNLFQECQTVPIPKNEQGENKLIETYINDYSNINIYKQVHCFIKEKLISLASFLTDNSNKYGDNMMIPAFLTHLETQFGNVKKLSSGANGMTLLISYKHIPNAFVIKIPLNEQAYKQESFHEAIVASYLNQYRDLTTGFMYGFGGFYCGANQNGICNTKQNVSFLSVFEMIQGRSFTDMMFNGMLDSDINDILSVVMIHLAIAQDKLDFIHNDLHIQNIMIRKLKYPKEFKYKNMTVRSIFEPVIIDYGYSTVTVNNKRVKAFTDDLGYDLFNQPVSLKLWDVYRIVHNLFIESNDFRQKSKYYQYLISYFFDMNPKIKDKIMMDFYRQKNNKINYEGPWPYFIYSQEKWPVDFLSKGDAYDYLKYLRNYK